VGGQDRVDHTMFTKAGDSLIVNGGSEYWQTHEQHPRDTGNWLVHPTLPDLSHEFWTRHIDGDWFTHHLDSSDQALVGTSLAHLPGTC